MIIFRNCMFIVLLMFSCTILLAGCGGGGSAADIYTPPSAPDVVKVSLYTARTVSEIGASVPVYARVVDQSGRGIKGKTVHFTATSGVIATTQATTDEQGMARSAVQSFSSGNVKVTADCDGYKAQKDVFYTDDLTYKPSMKISVDSGNGTYDEQSDYIVFETSEDNILTVKVNISRSGGRPASGEPVSLSTLGGVVTVTFLSPSTTITDSAGDAYFVVKFTPQTLTTGRTTIGIIATATVDGTDLREVVSIAVSPVVVTRILLTASPDEVKVTQTSTVQAKVYITGEKPAPDGLLVAFTSTCGSVTPYSETTNGTASATFKAPAVVPADDKCTVTASAGGVSSTIDIGITADLLILPPVVVINGVDGGLATYQVKYGKPPYYVKSSSGRYQPNTYTLNNSGETFWVTVQPRSLPEVVTLTVTDSAKSTATATLEIIDPSNTSFTVIPQSATVKGIGSGADGDPSDDITFYIRGGAPPYTVVSTMPGVIPSPPVSGNYFTVDPNAVTQSTQVVIIVADSMNRTVTVTITVNP